MPDDFATMKDEWDRCNDTPDCTMHNITLLRRKGEWFERWHKTIVKLNEDFQPLGQFQEISEMIEFYQKCAKSNPGFVPDKAKQFAGLE